MDEAVSDAHGPGADGAYAVPAAEPVTCDVGTIRYNPAVWHLELI